MKKLFLLSALIAMPVFANPPAAPASAVEATKTVETKTVETSKTAASNVKVSYKEAKSECLKGDATLKGKALKECIKGKVHH